MAHPEGSVNLARDVKSVDLELAFSGHGDHRAAAGQAERRDRQDGAAKTAICEIAERDLLAKLNAGLENGVPIRDIELTDEEERVLRGYQFLTAKPLMLVLNIGEAQLKSPPTFEYPHRESDVVALCGKVEAELAQLDDEDARSLWKIWASARPHATA